MTTIINSPKPESGNDGVNFLIGMIATIAFILIIVFFVVPALQNMGPVKIETPATQIVVPDKIDVDVKQTN